MAIELATAYISLAPSAKGMKAGIERDLSGAGTAAALATEKSYDTKLGGVTRRFGRAMKLAALGAVGFGVGAVALGLKSAVDAASDLDEATSKINAIFGPQGQKDVDNWASKAAGAFGQSKIQATDAIGTYGNLLTSFGVGNDDALTMSKTLTGLASDLASFNNTSVDEAIVALRSGLSGETEPLKRYGVALDDASLKAKALAMGISDGKTTLTPAAKAQAAYALILERTKNAQGDFARTSGGLANQQRIFAARWDNLKTSIGRGLLPVINKLLPVIGGLFDKIEPFANKVGPQVQAVFDTLGKWWDENGETITTKASSLFDTLSTGSEAVVSAVKKHWPQIKTVISSVVETVSSVVTSVVSIIKTTWNNFGDNILSFTRRAWGPVRQVISGALEIIRGLFSAFAALLKGDWSGVWDGLGKVVSGAFNLIVGSVKVFFENIRLYLSIGLEVVKGLFTGAWEGIKDTASDAVDAVVDFFKGLPGKIGDLAAKIGLGPVALGKAIIDGFLAGFGALLEEGKELASALKEAFAAVWDDVADLIEKGLQKGIDALDKLLPVANFDDDLTSGIIPRFHTGGVYQAPRGDEGLAILRSGERVLSPAQTAAYDAGGSAGVYIAHAEFTDSARIPAQLEMYSMRDGRRLRRGMAA